MGWYILYTKVWYTVRWYILYTKVWYTVRWYIQYTNVWFTVRWYILYTTVWTVPWGPRKAESLQRNRVLLSFLSSPPRLSSPTPAESQDDTFITLALFPWQLAV